MVAGTRPLLTRGRCVRQTHVGNGLMLAGARLTVLDLSDNAVGMDGLHVLLTSPVCYTLQRLLLNNTGWGPTGGMVSSAAAL